MHEHKMLTGTPQVSLGEKVVECVSMNFQYYGTLRSTKEVMQENQCEMQKVICKSKSPKEAHRKGPWR